MSAHAKLSPSKASVWAVEGGCPGYIHHTQPTPPGQAAEWGTKVHDLAARMAAGAGRPEQLWSGEPDHEAFDIAAGWAEDSRQLRIDRAGHALTHALESRVPIRMVHPECFGTVDEYLIDWTAKEVWIRDLKTGRGPVSAIENAQLLCYAIGVAEEHQLWERNIRQMMQLTAEPTAAPVPDEQPWTFHLVIDQPRVYQSQWDRVWTIPESTAIEAAAVFNTNASIAMDPNAPVRSGKQCKYCELKLKCPAFRKAADQALEFVDRFDSTELTPDELSVALRVMTRGLELITGMHTALSEQVEAKIRGGMILPGWTLKPGRSNEKWIVDPYTVAATGDLYGIDVRKPDVLTPNQARAAGLPDEIVAGLSERPPAPMKLAPEKSNHVKYVFSCKKIKSY